MEVVARRPRDKSTRTCKMQEISEHQKPSKVVHEKRTAKTFLIEASGKKGNNKRH